MLGAENHDKHKARMAVAQWICHVCNKLHTLQEHG